MIRRGLLASAGAAAISGPARAAHELRPWPRDRMVPRWSVTDLDGRLWNTRTTAGQVLLLNFWASWCEPCRVEMPSLEWLLQRRAADGLRVLAVNHKEGAPAVSRFLAASPLALPVALDGDGDAARSFGVRVLPSTVLIDRLGRPHATLVGEFDWAGDEAQALLQPILGSARRS